MIKKWIIGVPLLSLTMITLSLFLVSTASVGISFLSILYSFAAGVLHPSQFVTSIFAVGLASIISIVLVVLISIEIFAIGNILKIEETIPHDLSTSHDPESLLEESQQKATRKQYYIYPRP